MSTLTKILIVLLTLSSIFLCGIVVTYVANAENYKQLYLTEKADKDAAVAKRNLANTQLGEKKKEYQRQADGLKDQMAKLNTQILSLRNELTEVKREKTDLDKRVQSWVSVTKSWNETTQDHTRRLDETLDEMKALREKQTNLDRQLDESIAAGIEKDAVIDTLRKQKRQLEQERSGLLKQLDQLRLPVGKETLPFTPVIPDKTPARPAPPPARDIGLKGLVTAVDLKNSLAEISVGTARGVREGMRFYVTRGDKFICEVLVFYVDAEKAVGILEPERMKFQPKIGDNASTNL